LTPDAAELPADLLCGLAAHRGNFRMAKQERFYDNYTAKSPKMFNI
jgi:hypothetical protein